ELYFVRTEYQLADMFTKALSQERFEYLVRRLGMRCLTPAELEYIRGDPPLVFTVTMESLPVATYTQHMRGSYALSWKPCQEDSSKLNLLDHRFRRRCSNLIPTESDSSPHAHTQAAKTYYKHQDSRIEKAQVQRQRLPQL
ncbi:hypothetical protein Tco_0738175, partial [Tanacetum coccineum]